MKQYNIYVRLNKGSGEVSYQYTTLAKSYDEAKQETYEAACDKCESIARLYGLYDAEDNIEEDDLTFIYIIENGSFSKIDRK